MLKGLGLVFLSLLLAGLITLADKLTGSGFMVSFAKNNSIEVIATIFALNVATATFLIGGLLNVEEKIKKVLFDGPRREIKHNLYAMAFLFVLNLLLASGIGNQSNYFIRTGVRLDDVLAFFVITILLMYLYLILEIVRAVFSIKFTNNR